MNLTIIIPTHHRFQEVTSLIESLSNQTLSHAKFELIVVSNLPDKKLSQWLRHKSFNFAVTYFETGRTGVNIARNSGLSKARSELIYFLDDDVKLINPDHLLNLLALAESHPHLSAIGGGYVIPRHAAKLDQVYHSMCSDWLNENTNNLVGGNTLYNLKNIKEKLSFNEKITFGGSETATNLSLLNNGYQLKFFTSLNILHSTHLNLFSFGYKAYKQGFGRSLHEELVPKDFWKTTTTRKSTNTLTSFYCEFYDFFFHVGYRKEKTNESFFKCLIKTFFQIDSEKFLNLPDPMAKGFHETRFPSIKFKALHHWFRGNIWWKIPNTIFWKIIPAIGNVVLNLLDKIIPATTGKLRKSYHQLFDKLEKKIMRNN